MVHVSFMLDSFGPHFAQKSMTVNIAESISVPARLSFAHLLFSFRTLITFDLLSVLPVIMYWESPLKAQSQTHLCVFSFSSVIRVWSAVRQILQVWSAEVVASNLQTVQSETETVRSCVICMITYIYRIIQFRSKNGISPCVKGGGTKLHTLIIIKLK